MKKSIIISIIVSIILIIIIAKSIININNKEEDMDSELTDEEIYELMMNTVSRNIINMDPAEMSSDELEFYYNYIYDNTTSEQMKMNYDDSNNNEF